MYFWLLYYTYRKTKRVNDNMILKRFTSIFVWLEKIISIKVDNINGSLTIQEHSNIQFLHFKREKKGFDQIFRARN